MCFIEPEWKFLNDKQHEVSKLYGIPKIHKYMNKESAINAENSAIIKVFEPNDLRLRPTRKPSQLFDVTLQPFLKCIKSFIGDNLDFLNKFPRDVDEETEIVRFGVISLLISIPHEFGLGTIDYFFTKYQE